MTLAETFALVSFSLFSYADLRHRLVPGIEVFLFGTILLTFPVIPFKPGLHFWLAFGASPAIFPVGSPCPCCFIHISGRYYSPGIDLARA